MGSPTALKRGAVKVTVTCARVAGTGCRLSLRLTIRRKLVASKSFTLGEGKHVTIKLTLNRTGMRLLANAKHQKLTAVLSLSETGTNGVVTTVSNHRLTLVEVLPPPVA